MPTFSLVLDPRDRMGGVEEKLGVRVRSLRTVRLAYWANVSGAGGLARVVPVERPLHCCYWVIKT